MVLGDVLWSTGTGVIRYSILSIISFGSPNIAVTFSPEMLHYGSENLSGKPVKPLKSEMIQQYIEHHFEPNPNDNFKAEG